MSTSQRALRSSSTAVTKSSGPVLGNFCVICQKQLKWVKVGKKRVRDKLSTAETDTGGEF